MDRREWSPAEAAAVPPAREVKIQAAATKAVLKPTRAEAKSLQVRSADQLSRAEEEAAQAVVAGEEEEPILIIEPRGKKDPRAVATVATIAIVGEVPVEGAIREMMEAAVERVPFLV